MRTAFRGVALFSVAQAARFSFDAHGVAVKRADDVDANFLLTARLSVSEHHLPAYSTPLFVRFDAQPWQTIVLPPRTQHWVAMPLPSETPSLPRAVTCVGVIRCSAPGDAHGDAHCLFVAALRLSPKRSTAHWDVPVSPFPAPAPPCPHRFTCLPAERNGTVAVLRWGARAPSRTGNGGRVARAWPLRYVFALLLLFPLAACFCMPRRPPLQRAQKWHTPSGARSSSAGRATWGAGGPAPPPPRARSVGPSEWVAPPAAREPPLGGAFAMLVTSLALRARQAQLLAQPRGPGGVKIGAAVVRERLGSR